MITIVGIISGVLTRIMGRDVRICPMGMRLIVIGSSITICVRTRDHLTRPREQPMGGRWVPRFSFWDRIHHSKCTLIVAYLVHVYIIMYLLFANYRVLIREIE